MSHRLATRFFSLALLLLSGSAYAGDREVVEKLNLLASGRFIDVLQTQGLSGEERMTAYIYANRIEYYDKQVLAQVEKLGKLPAASEDGVPFTEVLLTQFKNRPDLYVVQRGWDKNGNCRVLTSKLGIHVRAVTSRDGVVNKEYDIDLEEEGNTCSGDPCRLCAPFDPDNGCLCKRPADGTCNHSITTLE